MDIEVLRQLKFLGISHHEIQDGLGFAQEVRVALIFSTARVGTEPLKDDVEARPAGRTMEGTVIGCSGLQQEAQEREVQFEALEADVCEGLVRWALAGVGPVREQQLRDLEAEAADHLGLLFVPSHGLTKQEDDAGEHGVPIFGGGLDICAYKSQSGKEKMGGLKPLQSSASCVMVGGKGKAWEQPADEPHLLPVGAGCSRCYKSAPRRYWPRRGAEQSFLQEEENEEEWGPGS